MELLHDVLTQVADRHPDRIALQSPDAVLSFSGFVDRFERLAGGLIELGVQHGDRVAILAPNCADYLAYHYATASIGAVLLVLNTRHTLPELRQALQDAEASVLALHADFSRSQDSLRAGCPALRLVIGLGRDRNSRADNESRPDHETDALAAANLPLTRRPTVRPTDPALLIYTSGTTGRPKGALQTHLGSVTIDALTARSFDATECDVYLAFMPYFHQAGLIRSRAVATRGGRSLYPGEKLDAERLVKTMRDERVTITMLVPPYDTKLVEIAERDDVVFPDLRLIVGAGGAGRRHARRMQRFCERFDCGYLGVYGQTEVTGPATVVTGPEYFANPATCGRALEGIDLEIWGESETAVGAGEIGEIMIRGATCIPGYWHNEEATTALYTGDWLHTGDLAFLDEGGFVYFVDRKKELIKTGGENVYPREVEDVLRRHPKVADVAVFGLPDPGGWGERVAAAIVVRADEMPSLEVIREFCRDRIAGYKIPKALMQVDSIPRNLTGKPLKRVLRDPFLISEVDPS